MGRMGLQGSLNYHPPGIRTPRPDPPADPPAGPPPGPPKMDPPEHPPGTPRNPPGPLKNGGDLESGPMKPAKIYIV